MCLGGRGGLILRRGSIEPRIDPSRLSVRDYLGIGARNARLGGWSSRAVRRSPAGKGFDADGRDAAANDTDLFGGAGRKIDNETPPIGPAIIDLDDHCAAGVEVCDSCVGSKRQRTMGCRRGDPIENLAARGTRAHPVVPGRSAGLAFSDRMHGT